MRTVPDFQYLRHRTALFLIWFVTGLLSLGLYPLDKSIELLGPLPVSEPIGRALVISGGLLDLLMALLIVIRPGTLLWKIQLVVVVFYTGMITILVPEYWLHPFGPVLKNLAVIALLWQLLDQEEDMKIKEVNE